MDFNAVSLFLTCGVPLVAYGVIFGRYHWIDSVRRNVMTPTGTVMLAVLPPILGFQAILLAVVLGLVTVGPVAAAPAAPGFRVKLLDAGRVFDSREMMGKKVVVLRFQASYCTPCAREAAAFGHLVERYRGRDVEFLALHVQDTVADTRRFVRTQRITYPVALDPKLTIGNRYGVKGTPYTVVIDRKGEIAARLPGESAVTRLPRVLDDALRQGAPKS